MEASHALPLIGVDSIADIDASIHRGTDRYQVYISELTPLPNALEIHARMRAGAPGAAFRVFNPELVIRKVEAVEAVGHAIGRINNALNAAVVAFVIGQLDIAGLQANIELGEDAVHVGPSINHRALPHQHVVYASNVPIPDLEIVPDAAPVRRWSNTMKVQSRKYDGKGQVQFWRLNLAAVQAKQDAISVYINALAAAREQLAQSALHGRTLLGSGYADYTFRF